MDDIKYFSRSKDLLTRDRGWIKPILVMAAANLVPIAGPLGNKGYALEYARLTAWGVDAAPKQKNVDVGKCVTSGARAFVVDLGWGLLLGLLVMIPSLIIGFIPDPLAMILALLLDLVLFVVSACFAVYLYIAELRCSIYESISAGFKASRILELVKRDTQGLTRVVLMNLACGLVLGLIGSIVCAIAMIPFIPMIVSMAQGYADQYEVLTRLGGALVFALPMCAVFGYLISILANIVRILVLNAVGLWMRQFDVPHWGRSEDPLPEAPSPTPSDEVYTSTYVYSRPTVQQEEPMPEPNEPNEPNEPKEDEEPTAPILEPLEKEPAQQAPEAAETVDDLYDDMMQTIRKNDHVPGDDDE